MTIKVGIGSSGAPNASITKIEVIVNARHKRHVEIHPLQGLRTRVVDGMRMPGPADDTSRPFHCRCAAIDSELRLTVKNDKHFLNDIVKMVADTCVFSKSQRPWEC